MEKNHVMYDELLQLDNTIHMDGFPGFYLLERLGMIDNQLKCNKLVIDKIMKNVVFAYTNLIMLLNIHSMIC